MPSFSSRGKCKSSYGGVQRRAIFTEVNVKTCGNSFGGKCLIHHKLKHHCFSANGPKLFWKYLQCLRLTGDCHKIVSLDPLHTCFFSRERFETGFWHVALLRISEEKRDAKGRATFQWHANLMVKTSMPQSFSHVFYQANIWKEATQPPERHFLTPQFGGNWTAKKSNFIYFLRWVHTTSHMLTSDFALLWGAPFFFQVCLFFFQLSLIGSSALRQL